MDSTNRPLLPVEIFRKIVALLQARDICALEVTCKSFSTELMGNELPFDHWNKLWHKFYTRVWGCFPPYPEIGPDVNWKHIHFHTVSHSSSYSKVHPLQRKWDLSSFQLVRSSLVHSMGVTSLLLARDYIISGSHDTTIKVDFLRFFDQLILEGYSPLRFYGSSNFEGTHENNMDISRR